MADIICTEIEQRHMSILIPGMRMMTDASRTDSGRQEALLYLKPQLERIRDTAERHGVIEVRDQAVSCLSYFSN